MSQRVNKGGNALAGDDNKTRKKSSKTKGAEKHEKVTPSDICKDCNGEIGSDTKALSCNFCHKWVCTACLEISDDLYQVLTQNPKSPLLVPCKDCSGQIASLSEMRNTLNEVKLNQSGTRKQLEELNKKVGSINKDLQKTVKEVVRKEVSTQLDTKLVHVECKLEEHLDKKFAAMECSTNHAEVMAKEEIRDMVREACKEERQKELRKPNLMLFNVPEKTTRDSQSISEHDRGIVFKILRTLVDIEDLEDKVLKIFRIGRRLDENRSRPIKIVFSDVDTKFKLLQKAYLLYESKDNTLNSERISKDRTPNEIKQYKELKKELEIRIRNGETNLRIRRGEIVSTKEENVVSQAAEASVNLETDREIIEAALTDDHTIQ